MSLHFNGEARLDNCCRCYEKVGKEYLNEDDMCANCAEWHYRDGLKYNGSPFKTKEGEKDA